MPYNILKRQTVFLECSRSQVMNGFLNGKLSYVFSVCALILFPVAVLFLMPVYCKQRPAPLARCLRSFTDAWRAGCVWLYAFGCLSDAHRLSHLVQDGQDAILEQMLSYKVSL